MVKAALITALFIFFLLFQDPVLAITSANLFQITTDGAQQKDAFIYKTLVAYTNFGGSQGIDIWGYNARKQENFPIIERPGQQFITGLFENLIVYEDVDGASNYNVRLYDMKKKKDMLIAGGTGAETSGVTNGKVVAYINGGACGSLNLYDLRKKTTKQIEPSTCHPIRMWDNIIVYPIANPGGTDIRAYNIRKNEAFNITTEGDFQEVPNIYKNYVVWLHRTTGAYGDPNSIVLKNLRTGEETKIYESSTDTLNWPAISDKYVVWSQSSAQHLNGIMGANISTGELFEVQPQGSHQNSHTIPSIWQDSASWMSFRTGNGDIYGAKFNQTQPEEPKLLMDNFDGTSLDTGIWEIFPNGGNISVADGFVTLSAGSAMPFVRANNNPFPISGPFTLEFGIQYISKAEGGNGVAISFSQQPNVTPGWENTPLAVWQDNVGFGLVGSGSYLLTISPSDFNYHVVKISYDGNKYTVRIDGSTVYTSPDTARVGALWFGHPNYCCTSGWTSFKLDYIKVTQP